MPSQKHLRIYLEPAQPDSTYQASYCRLCDLPLDQAEAFRQWMRDSYVWQPMVPEVPDDQQDGFYPWEYDKWRIEDLHHERHEVVSGEMFTGLVISARDIVLALPDGNLTSFALQHARHARCSNLLDVLEPDAEQINCSTGYYLRQFRAWRHSRAADQTSAHYRT